ncbi:MAG: response regulator [Mariprofundus sp.]|nr:response regulator [Mariprofundus sp.]
MTRYALPSAMFFKQVDHLLMKMVAILAVIIIASEFVVMMLFSWLGLGDILSPVVLALADALTLFCIAAWPMYLWFIKPVKEAIYASQHRHDMLSSAVKYAGDGIVISNRAGTVEYVNQAFRDILQCENEDIIGQPIAVLDSVMTTAAWKRGFIHAMRRDHVWHDEQWGLRKNGEKYLAKVTVTPIEMSEGEGISNFVTIVRDQTAHHDLEMQYYQAQKMEAVGTLVGGIAHDFNNMLSALIGHIYIAKAQLKNSHVDGKILLRLAQMEALGVHAAEMIQQLMTFARKSDVEKTTLALPSFMKDALKLAEVSLPANIDFRFSVQAGVLGGDQSSHQWRDQSGLNAVNAEHENIKVSANATQLQQVLMNLINNARDALHDVDQPQIRVSLRVLDAQHAGLPRMAVAARSYAEISVSDNGCGIAAKNLNKIMEPFFTTKAIGKGTGLGLSMVYGIVQDHHGCMDIISQPEHGTSIHIFLPISDCASDCASDELQSSGVYRGHGETILLVDDQQHVRESCREVLESLGYMVLEACDGVEAFQLYLDQATEISAVVSDVMMPRMQGGELASRIKQHNPALPVMLVSGYDRDDVLSDLGSDEVDLVLGKPVAIEVLSQSLHQMLSVSKTEHKQSEVVSL